MMNFAQEIEKALCALRNTNDKEQNMQGRLYAHFLQFEAEGYIVEMETSVNDEKLKRLLKQRMGDESPADFTKQDFRKIEIDLLVYRPDASELYAAELKWIYNRTKGWNVVDHLEEFKADSIFCHQLVAKARFTETVSLVVYDFYEPKQVKRYSPKRQDTLEEKLNFLGGAYPARSHGSIVASEAGDLVPFEWRDLQDHRDDRDYKYYLLAFRP